MDEPLAECTADIDGAGYEVVVVRAPRSPALSSSPTIPPTPLVGGERGAEFSSASGASEVESDQGEGMDPHGDVEGEYGYMERVAALIAAADRAALATNSRRLALQRYKEKRAVRSFKKKIRYQSRKCLAESRPRVGGRFVKREKEITQ